MILRLSRPVRIKALGNRGTDTYINRKPKTVPHWYNQLILNKIRSIEEGWGLFQPIMMDCLTIHRPKRIGPLPKLLPNTKMISK
jgi:hypothetical protein